MVCLLDFIEKRELFDQQELEILSRVLIISVKAFLKEKKVDIYIKSEIKLAETLISRIKKCICENITECNTVNFLYYDAQLQSKLNLDKEWKHLTQYIFTKVPSARMWMLDSSYEINKDVLNIYISKDGMDFLKARKVPYLIEKYIKNKGFSLKVVLLEKENDKTYDIYDEEKEIVAEILNQNENNNDSKTLKDDSSPILIGKFINNEPMTMSSIIFEENAEITILGEVFDCDMRETRTNKLLITFGLTDSSDSIPVRVFLSDEQMYLKKHFKDGCWLKIRGKVIRNKYTDELELMPFDIIKAEKTMRKDNYPEKRVELHLHTRYSSMDAVCAPKDVVNMAKAWGHPAIAVTDHGVVQSFPEVYAAAKANNIKPIYGMEAYIFDDLYPVMLNPPDVDFKDAVFVAVDIETTGLSFDSDEIIEIGAVKIHNGEIVDEYNSLIKPSKPLSAEIINLTGITNEMLVLAPKLEEVLPSFLKFLGEGIFVAHNAEFDSGFIRRDCKKLKYEFNNDVLDTLSLSKIVFSNLKNHKLDTIARELNINMGNHHRATDDANTAGLILIDIINRLNKVGINNLSAINKVYEFMGEPVRLNSYHATILVKNQQGIKELYELVSKSHLNYFYRHPRIPKSLLNSYRDGLILGTGCQAGEFYQSLLHCSSELKIERIVKFYDFLEIQPISNNAFLFDNGLVSSREKLEEFNLQIYKLGKKYKKPVVITGDVHFLNPDEDIYRKILLNGQGYKDFDKDSGLYFRTTAEMLKECEYLGKEAANEVVITNTNKIAAEIDDDIKPIPDKLYTPKIDGAEQEIINMTYKKAHDLYGNKLPDIVEKRIERELNSIVNNGYSVIYLIAHKLVKKSLEDGFLVGSRGSVGSSLVATMCEITEVNPLPPHYLCPKCKKSIFVENIDGTVGPDLPDKNCPECNVPFKKEGFNIPFEVFLGFKGDKVPDIDLNFSGEYQSRAHKYTEELFGKDYVFRAGTISTVAEKTAYGFAKSYFEDKNMEVSNLEIKRMAAGITGVKRTTGQHPGGVMVVPKDKQIFDFTPIQYPANDKKSQVITTHFDYHSISDRLLKLDLLGHDDPTMIKMLEQHTGVDARSIPLDEKDTMAIFSSLDSLNLTPEDIGTTVGTLGVPEFGTRFVRQMLEDTRPTTFAELVRISGLSHGTDVWLNNAQDLIKKEIATLKDVIATRDDIMNYLINKGLEPQLAFKIMEDVRKGRGLKPEQEEVLNNANIDSWFIDSCKKIKYLFPKAHAVAYVIMAFRIAFYKVHYPEAFYATYFSTRAEDFDAAVILQGQRKIKDIMAELKLNEKGASAKEKNLYTLLEVVNEMYMRGIHFAPIDLYKSGIRKFKLTQNGILPPMISLQGLGLTAAQNIAREREKVGFTSIEDLRQRTKISKTVVEILRQNGVLNNLQETNQISLF